MTYSDEHLQNHELNYWLNGFNPPLHHQHFYNEFFPFENLNSKKTKVLQKHLFFFQTKKKKKTS
jgi:hypothetical protein